MQSDREEDRERLTVPATANQTIKRAGKRNYGLSLRLEDAGSRARVAVGRGARSAAGHTQRCRPSSASP